MENHYIFRIGVNQATSIFTHIIEYHNYFNTFHQVCVYNKTYVPNLLQIGLVLRLAKNLGVVWCEA